MHLVLELTEDQLHLLQSAAEVTDEKVCDFIVRAAIEEADGVAHMHSEAWDTKRKLVEQNNKLIEQLDTVPNQIESVSGIIQSNTANINAQWEKIHNLQKQIDFIAEHVGIKKKRNE